MPAPLPQYQRDYIIQLLALGNTKREIISKFEQKYGRKIHKTTIIRLKQQQAVAISEAHEVIANGGEIVGAAVLKQKSYRLLNNRLDRAIRDEDEIDVLREQFASGEISKDEFDRGVARYEKLTITELTKLSDAMHQQSKTASDDEALSPTDQAALQMIMKGLNNGNPLQLVQVVNPQTIVNPIVGTPAPQAGTADQP